MTDEPGKVSFSPQTLTLLRRLRIQYRSKPDVYRDLLAITTWAYLSADGREIDLPDTHNPRSEMTADQVAAVLGVTARSIRRHCAQGRIKADKRAGVWWITPQALAAYRARAA